MKKIFALLLSLLLVSLCATSILANDIKVVDEVDYLTETEEQEITELCNEFIQYTGMDCVVYLTEQYGVDVQKVADDYFDFNGYGFGSEYEGIILCINYGDRDYTISTCGSKATDTFTDFAQEAYMYPNIADYLSQDDTAEACKEFVRQALSVYRNYDYFHQPEVEPQPVSPPSFWERLRTASTFGGMAAAVATMISYFGKRGQLKSTGEKYTAGNYVTDAHVNMFRSGEVHLYTNVLRRRIDNDSHSHNSRPSSHSSTHISSSGRTHGGTGSHKF